MVRINILKIDTGRVILKYRPTKTNPKYFLPEDCHLNGPFKPVNPREMQAVGRATQ